MKKDNINLGKISVILADIDGTLVNKGEQIMPKTKEMITFLHEKGVLFGLATGRKITHQMFARKDAWKLSFDFDVMIGMNGGQLWDRFHDEYEEYCLLSTDTMKEILDMMAPLKQNAFIYEEDYMVSMYLDEMVKASMSRNKINVVVTDGDAYRLCIKPNFNILYRVPLGEEKRILAYANEHPSDKYIAVHTSPGIIEFMDPRVNKGLALKKFSERNRIPVSEIMAFGDMDNDKDLVKEAGWGVCLLNGSDLTKANADDITDYPCTEDGMGRYLEKLWNAKAFTV